jgi:CheY-like chemotaxis protein
VKYSAEGEVTINLLLDDFLYYEKDDEEVENVEEQMNKDELNDEQTEAGDFTVGGRTMNTGLSAGSSLRSRSNGNHSLRLMLPSTTASFRSRATVSYYSHGGNSRAFSSKEGQMMPFLRVEVEDTGIGMSEEAMASLFSPFKQNQRLAGGTGLGLYSLAKRLEALHGFYGVMKRRDGKQGSLFWFAIPYKPDSAIACLTALEEAPNVKDESSSAADPTSVRVHEVVSGSVSSNHSRKSHHSLTSVKEHEESEGEEGTLMKLHPFLQEMSFMSQQRLAQRLNGGNNDDVIAAVKHLRHGSINASISDGLSISSAPTVTTRNENPRDKALSILLVDDSPTIVKMSLLILRKLGHKVDVAENGALAVKMIEERLAPLFTHSIEPSSIPNAHRCYDVILMDLQMPVMDGLEATRRIRLIESGLLDNDHVSIKHIIVAMSANSDEVTSSCAMDAGVDMFLPKPFSLDSINSTLVSIVPTL